MWKYVVCGVLVQFIEIFSAKISSNAWVIEASLFETYHALYTKFQFLHKPACDQ
jgi:hypothetical protein